ncbi:ABC transporter substrate-binding protein [Alteromonas aestuariivivens]|uniref:ABC transporter substrate-binding protein n=1 Tax=Alteromonas aestuariivivens TaxID=1938339 RepID=A0A3D8M486_9ALTE|nr:transporter substrate-binding domain-containing protein [Alteromonas aestuariivivens]RDV24557.1 ABC transporter substrate-binding protein [Alteromonas aestuariivivens]
MIIRLCQLLLLIVLLIPGAIQAHAWLTLKIATTEYPPYASADMQHNGYINHIIAQALLETGVEVEFVVLPWEQAVAETLAGKYDALSYGYYVRAREDAFWHSDPVTTENLVFYASAQTGLRKWGQFDDLERYRMGVTGGYLYTDELADYIAIGQKVISAKSDLKNLQALVAGSIDVFPVDELTGWYLLQRDFTDSEREQIVLLAPIISTVTTHLLVPKGSRQSQLTLSLFNHGLRELTLQGKMSRFKRLLKEGFYQHPQKPVNYDRR